MDLVSTVFNLKSDLCLDPSFFSTNQEAPNQQQIQAEKVANSCPWSTVYRLG